MTQWHGGKGSAPRPYSVTQEEYDNRWNAIFGRDQTTDDCLTAFDKAWQTYVAGGKDEDAFHVFKAGWEMALANKEKCK